MKTRDLDAIDALVRWCRAHMEIPPELLVYDAAGAMERLREESGREDAPAKQREHA